MFAVDDRLADYEKWRDERATVVAQAGRPTIRVQTATAWAADAAQKGIDEAILDDSLVASGFSRKIDIVEMPGAEKRPRGARFGTLVHAVLATVPLDADSGVVLRNAETQGRIINAAAEEVRAASLVVATVLAHPLIARARVSTSIKRETPVSWLQKDGTLIEGVLDLAFDEGDDTVVVDFKTDHELAAGETRYRAQLQQYVHAVTRATGRQAYGVLFRV
jgi:ATP-dependent helicase/nuclease subunit A